MHAQSRKSRPHHLPMSTPRMGRMHELHSSHCYANVLAPMQQHRLPFQFEQIFWAINLFHQSPREVDI
jgi:hypothetical protein